jgi:hypothetical protein
MLDQNFCEYLEYHLCKAFALSDKTDVKGFCCDGILLPSDKAYYSEKFVNDNRQVILKAFTGKDGQTEYEVFLKFGDKALSRYTTNLGITDCLPDPTTDHWFDVDGGKGTIEVRLD